jgi:zeaxanthin glucosyltransferase
MYMAHLAILCLPMSSHMRLFLTLARALRNRGHRITFFGISNNRKKVEEAGFSLQIVEPEGRPSGTLGRMIEDMSTLGNFQSMRLNRSFDELRYQCLLAKAPHLVDKAGVDLMVVDQAEACGGTIADALNLPWVSVCNGLCLNSEASVPPFFSSWKYSDRFWAIARNKLAYTGLRLATTSTQRLINGYRKRFGLEPLRSLDDTFSRYAQICQQPLEFDFPRRDLPATFHYVGPIHSPCGEDVDFVDFAWERLDGRPLIYGSLGTLVNRHQPIFWAMAQACADLGAQLVLSLGGAGNPEEYTNLPGKPLVVRYAPQVDLLRRASLTLTHGGLNTTLESLASGVPVVAIPITFEQPAVASRIHWTGTGEFVRAAQATPARLTPCVGSVLRDPRYRISAGHMSRAISRSPGVSGAVDLIEEVIGTGRPVPRAA